MKNPNYKNQYSKEYEAYMEYALEQYLVKEKKMTPEEAKLKVSQEYERVMEEAKADRFL